MTARPSSAGGAATSGGVGFEDRVSAWFATLMLADEEGAVPFDLPETTRVKTIYAQVEEPIDDLVIETAGPDGDGFLFIQAKRGESPSSVTSKDFRETLDQFVHQWIVRPTPVKEKTTPWDRPLDPERDRFVLACGKRAAGTIGEKFPRLLARASSSAATLQRLARNKEEEKLLGHVLQTLRDSWQAHTSAAASDDDLLAILRIIRVERFEFAPDGSPDSRAIERLKRSVLEKPEQAQSAWHCLVQHAHTISENQGSATASDLLRELHRAAIALQVPRKYHEDIQALRSLTTSELSDLGRNRAFRFHGRQIHIPRPCVQALRAAVASEPLLVIGQPGAGKSATLFELATLLKDKGASVIAVQAETLCRDPDLAAGRALRLRYPLVEVLTQWQPDGPGYLLIDAFDAARSGLSSETVRSAIADIQSHAPHWHLVVAVRVFDLRHNPALQDLFQGAPPAPEYRSRDRDFTQLRHAEIPRFSRDEQEELARQAPEVHRAASRLAEPGRFGEHIWLPFHLRLLAELLEREDDPALDAITTQFDLLERYWRLRFDAFGEKRVQTHQLVKDVAHAMRVSGQLIADTPASAASYPAAFGELRSADILAEETPGEDERVKFGHHILADYAIGRYTFGHLDDATLQAIETHPAWLIQFRPSLDVAFERLWQKSPPRHEDFWQRAVAVEKASLRTIGKLIAPVVAARRASTTDDLAWLIESIPAGLKDPDHPGDPGHVAPGFRVLNWTITAAITLSADHPLVGERAGPWAWVADQLAGTDLSDASAGLLSYLLWNLTDDQQQATPEQEHAIGRAARSLLAYWQEREGRDDAPNRVPSAIRLVARTFRSDATASAEVLRPHLATSDVAARGYETLQAMSFAVADIIAADPGFAAEIYLAAFYRETRDDQTALGHNLIMPLSSSIRQKFEGARYCLGQHYGMLFAADPVAATRVAVRAAAAKVEHQEIERQAIQASIAASLEIAGEATDPQTDEPSPPQVATRTFELDGRVMQFQLDGSPIWGARSAVSDSDPQAFVSRWRECLATLEARDELLDRILDVIADENTTAFLWSEFLAAGADSPEWLGYRLREALASSIVLETSGLGHRAGNLLRAIYPALSSDERAAIERAILGLQASTLPEHDEERLVTPRGRLLGQIPTELIATEEARNELGRWEERGGPPPNIPPFTFGGLGPASIPESTKLGHRLGMAPSEVEAEPNHRIRSLAEPVESFASKYVNQTPDGDAAMALLPELHDLWNALEHAKQDDVHPSQRAHCWGTLVETTARIARVRDLPDRSELVAFVEQVLRRAAVDPGPDPKRYSVAEVDRFPGWGGQPRISAAEGVMALVSHPELASEEWLSTLRRLAEDPAPPVRLQIAWRLLALYPEHHELLWDIIDDRIARDDSGAVLGHLLMDALFPLRGVEAARVVPAVLTLRQRALSDLERDRELLESCATTLLHFHLFHDFPECDEVMVEIAADPVTHEREASKLLYQLRDCLTLTGQGPHGTKNERARGRATRLFCRLTQEFQTRWDALDVSGADMELAPSLAQLAERAAKELYFGSGAYDQKSRRDDRTPLSDQQRARFFDDLHEAFQALGDIGRAAVAHPLIETLNSLLPYSPDAILLEAARIVQRARGGGLGGEQLAHGEIVNMVERVLANHRDLLRREDSRYRVALLDLLDVFVEQGWREATALTFRVHEIYR